MNRPRGFTPQSDERGAIMVLGLVFALFAVAIVFTAYGSIQAILLRDRLQESVDAAALSGAVAHARIMNLLVLLNVVMAALLAILVTLKLIETLCIVGAIIAGGLAYPTFGASLAAVPPLTQLQDKVHMAHERLKPPIEKAIEVVHDAQLLIAEAGPEIGSSIARGEFEENGGVSSSALVAAPELPVEDDEFKVLCREAGEFPGALARKTLEGIPPLALIMGALEGAMGELSSSLSDWFCGSDGKDPEPYQRKEKVWLPEPEGAASCKQSSAGGLDTALSIEAPAVSACSDAQAYAFAASSGAPIEDSGGDGACRAGADCSMTGPYETQAQKARLVCDPTASDRPLRYSYRLRSGVVDYVYQGASWVRQEPDYSCPSCRSQKKEDSRPPCGPASLFPREFVGYELQNKNTETGEFQPVCTGEHPPTGRAKAGARRSVHFSEVSHIFACEKEITIVAKTEGTQAEDAPERRPLRIRMDTKLGDEAFQVRAVAGAEISPWAEKLVRAAVRSAPETESSLGALSQTRGLSFAQSEYFYDGEEGRDGWLWTMKWRARLVPFRGGPDELASLEEKCGGYVQMAGEMAAGAWASSQSSAEISMTPKGCTPLVSRLMGLGGMLVH